MAFEQFFKRLMTTILVILLLLAAWYLRSILMLGFLAVVMAVGATIPAQWLYRWGLTWWLAVVCSVGGLSVGATLLGLWILPTLTHDLATLIASTPAAFTEAEQLYQEVRQSNELWQIVLPPLTAEELWQWNGVQQLPDEELQALSFSFINSALPLLQGVSSIAIRWITNLSIVAIVAIFFLVSPHDYLRAGLFLLPRSYHGRAVEIWYELYATLTTWIVAQAITLAVTVVAVWVVLGLILRIPNALAVAVIAGLATFIPNLGAILSLIPIVIFTLAYDPSQLLVMVAAYMVLRGVIGSVFTPYLVRSELNIPAGGLTLFQVIATTLFGTLGLLLAVPLLAVLITLVREIYSYDVLGLRGLTIEFVPLSDKGRPRPGASLANQEKEQG